MSHDLVNCTCVKCKEDRRKMFEEQQIKINRYEDALRDILQYNAIKDDYYDYTGYVERDRDGNVIKKIRSNLTESFIVVDTGKDLDELDKKEINTIKMQDDLKNYTQTKQYIGKFSGVYSAVGMAVGVGTLVISIL